MTRYYTADTHLNHQNILRYEQRPYDTVQAMNEDIVTRWNSVVSDDDEVFVLGDVALGKLDDSLAYVSQLNGRKVLISGNHDRTYHPPGAPDKHIRRAARSVDRYLAAGFDEVWGGAPTVDTFIGDDVVLMSHFPYAGDSGDTDRYVTSRPADTGLWLLHGHVHSRWRVKGRQINVGVDVWNGYPVSERMVLDIIDGIDSGTEPFRWREDWRW